MAQKIIFYTQFVGKKGKRKQIYISLYNTYFEKQTNVTLKIHHKNWSIEIFITSNTQKMIKNYP